MTDEPEPPPGNVVQFLPPEQDLEEVTYASVIKWFNVEHSVILIGGQTRVLRIFKDENKGWWTHSFMKFQDFANYYVNRKMVVGQKTIPQTKVWLESSGRRTYKACVFQPGAPTVINGAVNLWRGYAAAPVQGDWSPMRDHIFKVLANENGVAFDYIMGWTADMLQHPGRQGQVALISRGAEGAGKSLFGRMLCKAIGPSAIHISSAEHLLGKHNDHLAYCVFLFSDEAFWPGDKAAMGALKRLITEPTLLIEPKFLPKLSMPNFLHVYAASNYQWIVPAATGTRRYAGFDAARKFIGNQSYFDAIYNCMDHGGTEAMMYDLINYNLSSYNIRNIPMTETLVSQVDHSLDPIDQWYVGLLDSGQLPGAQDRDPRFALSGNLYPSALMSSPRLKQTLSEHQLGRYLREECGCERGRAQTQDHHRGWVFPRLDKAREAWCEKHPGWPWSEGHDDWTADATAEANRGDEPFR